MKINRGGSREQRLAEEIVKLEQKIEQLEAAYSQQQQVWSDAIARADRYEAALRKIACDQQSVSCTCANESECSYGIARAALAGEKKDE